MSRFRYDITAVALQDLLNDPNTVRDELNERGRDGWELVSTQFEAGIVVMFLKREIPT